MEVFLLVVILGIIPAMIAKSKGRSFGLWWIYGAALFIIALPHSLIMSSDMKALERKKTSEGMKKCPFCAEMIKEEAIICRYCRKEQPILPSKRSKPKLKYCINCGLESPVYNIKCAKCGNKFPMAPQKIFCPGCGEDITHMPKECPSCDKTFKYKTS